MKIVIFGKEFKEVFNDAIYKIFEKLNKKKVYIQIYKPFYEFISSNLFFEPKVDKIFAKFEEIEKDTSIVLSIGGDGTFLESVSFMKESEIPFIGINSGRLGFLASISKEDIDILLEKLLNFEYSLCSRSLLEIEIENNSIEKNFALNELTVYKKDNSSMINIEVKINGHYLNTYWADGLIISTPTGSTAYSLSAGGPIIMPEAHNFVITPIAPHTLTVRPLIVADTDEIDILVKGRGEQFIAAVDSNIFFIDYQTKIKIKKAKFEINTIKFDETEFFSILRKKLMWGLDLRN